MDKFLIATAMVLLPSIASAYLDERLLYSRGAWTVVLTHDTNSGNLMCLAETSNRQSQSFSVAAHDWENPTVMVLDDSWRMTPGNEFFQIDIDYSNWTIDGWSDVNYVMFELDNAEQGWRYIEQLQAGTAVAVKNAQGYAVVVFSLSGSRGAFDAWAECWRRIENPNRFSDPF